jgi:hypothetical protein
MIENTRKMARGGVVFKLSVIPKIPIIFIRLPPERPLPIRCG